MSRESAFQTQGASCHDNHEGPQSHHTSSAARYPVKQSWREQATQCLELLCGPAVALERPLCVCVCVCVCVCDSYAKCAQISEREPTITVRGPHSQRTVTCVGCPLLPTITVRGPHSQRMSSAANAPHCNIRDFIFN
jgi:hypothetical protein